MMSCWLSGGTGDAGVWFGSSDSSSSAGWVLLQRIGQKLVVFAAAECQHDAGGENWSFKPEPAFTPEPVTQDIIRRTLISEQSNTNFSVLDIFHEA